MNIVILDGYTSNPGDLSWDALQKHGTLTVHERTAPNETAQRIENAHLVLTNKVLLTKELIEGAKNLQYIGVLATGTNVVDLAAAKECGVVVSNIPAYSTNEVAQHTMAMLLEICNRVAHHSQEVHSGRWVNSVDFCFYDRPLISLHGKTFGAIGFGAIGRRTAELAKAFGMTVLATGSRETDEGRAIADYVGLDELLERADVVSLHCPLLPQTEEIINAQTLAKMKDGAILLNTARGGLLQEEDVRAALDNGKLLAAGLDVAKREPIEETCPLLGAKNCFITPHIAWAPHAARARLVDVAEQNVAAFLNKKPQNVVNGL